MPQKRSSGTEMPKDSQKNRPVRFLLLIAGLGGLLYGIDLGIIAGALPYLQATAEHEWNLSAQQISFIVAAVAIGTILSCLLAGVLSDLFGRRTMMFFSGLLFVISIPMIAMASGYIMLLLGRLLQGVSGGLVGVVVPLYLAECLPASTRGKGTAIFQWLLTLGFVVAALIGLYCAYSVESVELVAKGAADATEQVLTAKDHAWRKISGYPSFLHLFYNWFVDDFGISALAVSTRPKRRGTCGAAPHSYYHGSRA